MGIAEIRGKISDSTNLSDRMEDLLTSDIFGCMRYLPPEKALIPFLRTARSFQSQDFNIPENIVKAHYSFWPRIESLGCIPCEPDVVIGLETKGYKVHMIFVEAKYFSGLSSEEDERTKPNDQLARELDNLGAISSMAVGWKPQLDVGRRTLLFVTKDMGMPRSLVAQSLDEYKCKCGEDGDIFWTSWRVLPSILEKSLKGEKVLEHVAILEDMLNLLVRKGLIMFHGVEPVTKYFSLPYTYHVAPTKYSWPKIPESFSIKYKYEAMK